MSTVRVKASTAYDVLIDEYSIDEAGAVAASIGGDAAFVVSDSNVAPLYLGRVRRSLAASGFSVGEFVFPAGEASKNLSTYESCLQAMAEAGLTRSSLVVALGGGVTGDMAGFAAATYMRGCRCLQIPTSLLACVDSSVGGKTAVDLPQGKNLVGAFFQPSAVLIDTATLATLAPHFFTDGCAEAIKYGVIADADLFSLLETPLVPGDARLARVITRCVAIKRDIVQADERERGARMLLNFGHTLGHGIEAVRGIKGRRTTGLYHGECVALGMLPMIESKTLQKRVRAVYRRLGLPLRASYDKQKVLAEMLHDKKAQAGQITLIKVPGLGCWRTETVPAAALPTLLGLEAEA